MQRTHLLLATLGAATACHGDPPPIGGAWQVTCPPGTEPCATAPRDLHGALEFPEAYLGCGTTDEGTNVHATFGANPSDPQGVGYGMVLNLGLDPATGAIDSGARCDVRVLEPAGQRVWEGACSETLPLSPDVPCRVEAPVFSGDRLELALRCERMPSILDEPGREADLGAPDDPSLPAYLTLGPCSE